MIHNRYFYQVKLIVIQVITSSINITVTAWGFNMEHEKQILPG